MRKIHLCHLPEQCLNRDTVSAPFTGIVTSSKVRTPLARQNYSARLDKKICLSESAQCYHFEFVVDELESFPLISGQFVSLMAADPNGKMQTRAYSLAAAANANRFELCVNRVEGGFFSNYLADLPIGDSVQMHGPHGHFVLHTPVTDSFLISTGTGIAPMRAMAQWLFPENGPDRSEGKNIWVIYGTRYPSELYYHDYFTALAEKHANFHYITTVSRAGEEYTGNRGYVQKYASQVVEERAAKLGIKLPLTPPADDAPASELNFDIYSYICGLNNMVSSVRDALTGYGWHKKQVIFERYD